jgi:hypothetical protein
MAGSSKSDKIDEVLGKAIRDKAFRQKLVSDPSGAAKEVGLSADELRLVAGGMAIGNSLLAGNSVAFCTSKTCNETGGARLGFPTGITERELKEG